MPSARASCDHSRASMRTRENSQEAMTPPSDRNAPVTGRAYGGAMDFVDALMRLFGGKQTAAQKVEERSEGAATAWRGIEGTCPQCGRPGANRAARASDLQLVASVAAEIVAYEAAHRDDAAWGARETIAVAHGLSVVDVADEASRIKVRKQAAAAPARRSGAAKAAAKPRNAIKVGDMRLLDLRHLDSVPLKLRGISHYVSERGRAQFGDSELVLKREPTNPHDAIAIAVYGKGRKLGHVSAARAAQLTPMLDRLGYDGYLVDGIVEQVPGRMTQLHVMLPRVPVLRAWAKGQHA